MMGGNWHKMFSCLIRGFSAFGKVTDLCCILTIFVVSCACARPAFGQVEKCLDLSSDIQELSDEVVQRHLDFEQQRSVLENDPALTSRSGRNVTVPVVFHVLYFREEENVSDDIILSQLDRLNEDFAAENADRSDIPPLFADLSIDARISFCLVQEDMDGRPFSGIHRLQVDTDLIGLRRTDGRRHVFHADLGGVDPWDVDRIVNIYICDMGDIGGLATRPLLVSDPLRQGIVLNHKFVGNNTSDDFNLGRIAVHEMGHYFGLEHTWGTADGCDTDDGIMDTPRQFGPYFGCPAEGSASCGSPDMYMTYMDYVDDECMHMFSAGQTRRMLSTLILARPLLDRSPYCTDADTTTVDHDWQVFPNPISSGELLINGPDDIEYGDLYDSSGRYLGNYSSGRPGWLSIPTDGLPSGVYLLFIKHGTSRHQVKFVKL